jgi:radical SAM family uncharacterized protein/radical SAM-linked protein
VEEGPVACRLALCYPDTYEVGMSHLGSRILYEVANRRADTACERAFLPWPDMQEQLAQRGLPLASLETKTPLRDLDLVGITLQYELGYPGVVRLLDLAQIPARAAERDERHPLVIGGGPCAAAPEPVAPFFDALVVGDGEEVLGEIIDACIALKADRPALLEALARIEGVYVPSLYETDGGRPATVRRRLVASLDSAPYPLRPVVPFLEIVHDRAQLEINRGCTHGCRFCQAGMLYRPVRQRSLETLQDQARAILASTGYEQISLSSLSCTDYPQIVELVDSILEEFGDKRVSISLPSLRTDQFGIELAQRVSHGRKSPVTLAPEAGSQRLRDVINKNVTDADLHEAAAAAFRAGWHNLKLYFMIGLPTETDEDLHALAETVSQVLQIGRQELGNRAGRLRIPVTVAGFVPKPHTVFEAEPQCSREELWRKQQLLREAIRDRRVELKLGSPDQSALEGILARGDRGLTSVIEQVAREGVGLEAWHEWFSISRWESALAAIGTSTDAELARPIGDLSESPWAHIDTGISLEFRARELRKAYEAAATPDCREGECEVCGLQDRCEVAADGTPYRLPLAPPPPSGDGRTGIPACPEPADVRPPVCRAMVTFAKEEPARYLAHLDITRALQRALRRAGLPVAYGQGYHQRPRMTIARPLPLGVTGEGELCAIDLYRRCSSLEFARALHPQLPLGLALREVQVLDRLSKSPFARVARAEYTVELEGAQPNELAGAVEAVLAASVVEVARETKRGERNVDIRPGITAASVLPQPAGVHLELACTDEYMVKPEEVVEVVNRALAERGLGPAMVVRVHRDALLCDTSAPPVSR